MTLEAGKEMDRKCVLDWLNKVYISPSLSYSEYTDEEIRIFAHDALVLLNEQETTSTAESRLFHCEKCGYGINDIYLSNEHDFDVDPHYCPNCGRLVV